MIWKKIVFEMRRLLVCFIFVKKTPVSPRAVSCSRANRYDVSRRAICDRLAFPILVAILPQQETGWQDHSLQILQVQTLEGLDGQILKPDVASWWIRQRHLQPVELCHPLPKGSFVQSGTGWWFRVIPHNSYGLYKLLVLDLCGCYPSCLLYLNLRWLETTNQVW